MTMGKGGVGKTTIAAAIATELARRGFQVHLSTTDPAAHVAAAAGQIEGLQVSRIDPQEETRAYVEQVMATAGKDLDANGRALLEEDLRSPCTEEIAVFRAFARMVAQGARTASLSWTRRRPGTRCFCWTPRKPTIGKSRARPATCRKKC